MKPRSTLPPRGDPPDDQTSSRHDQTGSTATAEKPQKPPMTAEQIMAWLKCKELQPPT